MDNDNKLITVVYLDKKEIDNSKLESVYMTPDDSLDPLIERVKTLTGVEDLELNQVIIHHNNLIYEFWNMGVGYRARFLTIEGIDEFVVAHFGNKDDVMSGTDQPSQGMFVCVCTPKEELFHIPIKDWLLQRG